MGSIGAKKRINMMNNFNLLKSLLKEVPRKQFIYFLVATIAKTFSIVILPFYIENVTGLAISGNYRGMFFLIFLYFILVSISEIIYIQISKRNYTVYNELRRNYSIKIQEKVSTMDYDNFESASKLEKVYAAFEATNSNDTGIEGIYHSLFESGWKLCAILIFTVYFSYFNPFIVLIFLIACIINYIFEIKKRNLYLNNIDKIYSEKRKLVYFTYDISDLSYGKEKRIYKFNDNIRNKYEEILNSYAGTLDNIDKKKVNYNLLKTLVDVFKYSSIFYILYKSFSSNVDVGNITAVLMIVFFFSNLLNEFINNVGLIVQELEKTKKVFDFIFEENVKDNDNDFKSPIESLEFRNVYFKYPTNNDYTISDCSFVLNKGESIAIIGLNGSGKTTLTKLMLGLYKPTKGNIYINGQDISNINLNNLYKSVAYVEQDYNLVSIKICDFISGNNANEKCDYDLVKSALNNVGLLKKIESFPNGIESTLTKSLEKDGVELSGGEIQKLYLARAIYRKKADLYIFDEPTSSLDYIAEKEVYGSFNRISKDAIAIFVTHKLNTTDFCDKIMIVDKGKIIDEGTKADLIANSSMYKKMIDALKDGD